MDFTRRKTLSGLGLLASGSGATFTSAAFSSSTDPNSDLRVVAADGLVVEAGDAFADDGTVTQSPGSHGESYVDFDSKGDFFDGSGGLQDISTADIPVATVNPRDQNTNGDVIVRKAVDFEYDTYEFTNILRLRNTGLKTVNDVAFKYEGGYGSAVTDQTNNISEQLTQYMYRFLAEDRSGRPQISPNGGNSSEDPAGQVDISPGEKLNVTLQLDYSSFSTFGVSVDPKQRIRDDTNTSGNPFTQGLDTVQLLQDIVVGEGWTG
ncbi:hypothetical protein [Halorubrum halodurans]|uniref:hypothetical protein n=1 Tax=Halorubrum halodurans TaxID=1383851 RepID=UPI00117A4FDB|nr:hypothetical protein [Halorubrum halodurans]